MAALFLGVAPVATKKGLAAGGNWAQATLVVVVVKGSIFWVALAVLSDLTAVVSQLSVLVVAIFLFTGFIASGFSRILYYIGLHRTGASVGNAIFSTRPLFTTVLGFVWLGESLTASSVGGVVLLIGGLVILSVSRGGDIGGWQRQDLVFPLVGALLFAIGNAGRRYGFTTTSASVLEAIAINETAALMVITGYLIVAYVRDGTNPIAVPAKSYQYFFINGLLAAMAFVPLFEAISRGPVGIVDSLVATSPLFTVFFTHFLLREVELVTRGILVGTAFIVTGGGLIFLFS